MAEERGVDTLLADIIQANYNGFVSTTTRLEINYLRQAEEQCLAVLEIFDVLDDATVVDRRTEARLWAIAHLRDGAQRTLANVRHHLTIHGEDSGEGDAS